MSFKNKAVFLDRDGTLIAETGYLDSPDRLAIFPETFEAVRLINASGMQAVVVTSQSGVARGLFTEDVVRDINGRIQSLLLAQGARIDRFYYCPHHPTEGIDPYRMICDCRKPEPGLLHQAARDLNLNLANSYLIGDHLRDVETAHRVGAKGILVLTGHGSDQAKTEPPSESQPDFIAQNILDAVKWVLKDRI